jgi:hypothetical protein
MLAAMFVVALAAVECTTAAPILGRPRTSALSAQAWARANGATRQFELLASLYWRLGRSRHVRADVAYAQAAEETGFGHFGGVLNRAFHNPCGLKTTRGGGNYARAAHQHFGSWRVGVIAHLDHLALYAGARGYPRAHTPDPRQFPFLLRRAQSIQSLGGRWAPARNYGINLARLVAALDHHAPRGIARFANRRVHLGKP